MGSFDKINRRNSHNKNFKRFYGFYAMKNFLGIDEKAPALKLQLNFSVNYHQEYGK